MRVRQVEAISSEVRDDAGDDPAGLELLRFVAQNSPLNLQNLYMHTIA